MSVICHSHFLWDQVSGVPHKIKAFVNRIIGDNINWRLGHSSAVWVRCCPIVGICPRSTSTHKR